MFSTLQWTSCLNFYTRDVDYENYLILKEMYKVSFQSFSHIPIRDFILCVLHEKL